MLETLSTVTPAKSGEAMPEWNEKEIVGRAQQGDMEACDALIRQYQERIYATIYHMTSNHEDAADLAQITFIKACLLYTSPSPRDKRQSRMPSSA